MRKDMEVKNRIKEILKIVQEVAPGNSVELRMPLYSAIQCVSGSFHSRGNPPNVVEIIWQTFIQLINNPTNLDKFYHQGLISAAGMKVNLKDLSCEISKISSSLRQKL